MHRRKIIRWVAIAVAAAALFVASRELPFARWLGEFGTWLSYLGPAAFVLYAAAYAVVTVLLGPAWLMTIAAGLFFGVVPGTAVVSVGSTLGAAAAFLIGRHVARDRVARRAAKDPRFAAVDRAIARKGWKIVFLLRLSPLVPFVFSNYFYGVTAVRFWPYVAATWVGMIPVQLLYATFGAAGRDVTEPVSGLPGRWKWALLAVAVLLTVAATLYVARVARQAIVEEKAEEAEAAARDKLRGQKQGDPT